MRAKELSTSQVAKLIGVDPDLLRKWKFRGLLKLAPQGVAGQGRGVECHWSDEAIEEARQCAASRNSAMKPRTRK